MLDTFSEVFGDLRRNLLRTIATGFAVTSGLFLLIVLLGAGNGLIHSFTHNMGGFAFDAIHVWGGWTSKPFEGIKEGRNIKLDQRDADMARRRFRDKIASVSPSIEISGVASVGANYLSGTRVNGVSPEHEQVDALKMLAGRFVNQIDIQQKRKVAVISNTNVESLFDGIIRFNKSDKEARIEQKEELQKAIGRAVNVNGISFTIVGVYKQDDMSNNTYFYAPYTTISTIYNRGEFIDELTMTTKNIPTPEAMEQFEADYYAAASRIHSFDPTDRRALWMWNQAEDNMQMNNAMDILNLSFWILGLLTLLSGVVGVSNIMLISIKERTHEFGIRRAIGARPFSIIKMVVMEAIVITAIFGYIGIVLGVLFCEWMDATVGNQVMDIGVFQAKYFVDPTVDIGTCVKATVVIIIAGAIAGFVPALKTVKIKPIEALRG